MRVSFVLRSAEESSKTSMQCGQPEIGMSHLLSPHYRGHSGCVSSLGSFHVKNRNAKGDISRMRMHETHFPEKQKSECQKPEIGM
jgi:hypothetical protein